MNDHSVVQIFGILLPMVATLAFFTFLTITLWLGYRKRERDAFYKAETLRRITETAGEGAQAAIALLREDERLKRINTREGLKIGGVVNLGIGIGLMIFLWRLVPEPGVYLCGLIPALIGVALLVYVHFLASPIE